MKLKCRIYQEVSNYIIGYTTSTFYGKVSLTIQRSIVPLNTVLSVTFRVEYYEYQVDNSSCKNYGTE